MQQSIEQKVQVWQRFVSGLTGSFISATIFHPLEVVRTRFNLQKNNTGILEALQKIQREEGLIGYFKGYRVTIISVPLFYSLFLSLYEKHKKSLEFYFDIQGFRNNILASLLSGAICDILTNPLWVIKTRMQSQYLHDKLNTNYNGLYTAFRTIIKDEGFLGLYKGLGVSFLGLSHLGIQFPTYELIKGTIQQQNYGNQPKESQILFASSISKSLATFMTYPLTLVRTRLEFFFYNIFQRLQDNRKNVTQQYTIQIISHIWNQNGLRGLYRGIKPELIRVLPSNAISFIIYEKCLIYFQSNYPKSRASIPKDYN